MSNGPMVVRKKMLTARQREIQYGEESTPKPKFIHWLRGKFGVSVDERHGAKPNKGFDRAEAAPVV